MGSTTETLAAVGISRSFEGVHALVDVTLELARHEVVGLLGPNGAGKSTLVNLLSGFDSPTDGRVMLDDTDITSWGPERRGRAGLGRTFQHGHTFSGLSVRENVEVAALGVGAKPDEARRRADDLLELFELGRRGLSLAGELPHGEERLLGVARALATDPRFVLLDEPAAGLNEDEVQAFGAAVRMVCDQRDVGVLLIDHNIGLVFDTCDTIHVLDQGRTIAEGTAAEVRSDEAVATAYLGQP